MALLFSSQNEVNDEIINILTSLDQFKVMQQEGEGGQMGKYSMNSHLMLAVSNCSSLQIN